MPILRILLAFLMLTHASLSFAASPTVDTVIARHIAARGGADAIAAIHNLVFEKGLYSEAGYTGEFAGDASMILARPYYKLVGYPGRSKEVMEGYNGAAWEWYADPGIVLWTTGAASQASRHFAGVEGPFVDYKAKGSTAEYLGEETIGDRPTYRVRLTMMDGYATDNFFDQKSYMLIASRHSAKIHAFGDAVTSETRFSDFRRIAGVLFPFRSSEVEIATGKELNAMQWGSITANRDVPDAWFSPPEFKRTPVQSFIEQLYGQREDPSAVMWTYRSYRRIHPGEDTSDAAQVAGYQSLKMGAEASAIALLEQNAKDYPTRANAAFGLGRAYATTGRKEDARREFQRALKVEPGHKRAINALAALDN